MTAKRTYIIFIAAIFVTVLLTRSHGILPKRSVSIVPHPSGRPYLYSKPRIDGSPSGTWIDEAQRKYRCVFTDEDFKDSFYCSGIYSFEAEGSRSNNTSDHSGILGIDLSKYDKFIVDIDFQGPSGYIRFFFRNYNAEYSNPDDQNSDKFIAVLLDTAQLKRVIEVPIENLIVADWWLAQYKIPQSLSAKELNNVVSLGIDFAELRPPVGEYEIALNEVIIEGNFITEENWYLLIIYSWLAGIFLYASSRLFFMHLRNRESQKLISELSKKNTHLLHETDKFRKLSTVDALTNTYNRFGVDQVINSLSPSSQDSAKAHADIPYSLIVIDIDHFKRVNDNYGHDVGDIILRGVAMKIKESVGNQHFVARWGGEEFVIVLPDTDTETSFSLAEKIRHSIAQTRFETANEIAVTISAGVGSQSKGEDFASCFKRVDTAMFDAKKAGRNCSVIADTQQPGQANHL